MTFKSDSTYELSQSDIKELIAQRCGTSAKNVQITVMEPVRPLEPHFITASVRIRQEGVLNVRSSDYDALFIDSENMEGV